MAAGVGKTYRMLQEGRQAQNDGRDVVIGYLEPHDRPETAALADGIEQVPRLRSEHGDLILAEMDVDAVIARRPELALVDELAHTNAPGMRNAKRYEDIDEILAAGSDVISTVNIQHLESLNDTVAELTDVRVRETFPDRILDEADEVVLVDLTPGGPPGPDPCRQGLQARPHRDGPLELLPGGPPELAARARAPRGGRGRGGAGLAGRRPRRPQPPGRARADARSRHPGPAIAARRPAGVALGAAPERRARRALGAEARAASSRRTRPRRSPPSAAWSSFSAATSSRSRATASSRR